MATAAELQAQLNANRTQQQTLIDQVNHKTLMAQYAFDAYDFAQNAPSDNTAGYGLNGRTFSTKAEYVAAAKAEFEALAADRKATAIAYNAVLAEGKAVEKQINSGEFDSGVSAAAEAAPSGYQTASADNVATPRPNFSTAGGFTPGQLESTNGGYDPKANQLDPYTGAPNFTYQGGYDPNAIGSTGGGYDPDNPSYGNQSNSIGGTAAMSQEFNQAPSFAGGYYGDQTEPSGGGYDPSVQGLTDPKNARPGSKLPGGEAGSPAKNPSVSFKQGTGAQNANMDDDWRVRISLSEKTNFFYNAPTGENALLMPLKKTNGVIFPYTPSITVTHAAQYSSTSLTHSNYAQQFYNNSEVSDITIQGEFTVQNVEEGQYLMAAIYFFRSATKMFFGQGDNVGSPPPIVFLDGYGSHYFPHVPCVLSNFSHTLQADVDYMEIPVTSTMLPTTTSGVNQQYAEVLMGPNKGKMMPIDPAAGVLGAAPTPTQITTKTRLPTSSSISITLKPVYSRKNLHERFDLNKFAAGGLLRDKNGGYGGFL
jgi:hypothetical protein